MSERALRGTRLGATSYETDTGIDLAPRQDVEYACPNGHRFQMPFSAEADVPVAWECRVCGSQALRVGGTAEEDKPSKPARTHWDMLLERRSIPELEEVLAERLQVLRGGGFSSSFGSRGRRRTAPVNLATGAPETTAKSEGSAKSADGAKSSDGPKAQAATRSTGSHQTKAEASAKSESEGSADGAGAKAEHAGAATATATKKAPAKKTAARKTTAGSAPAKKTAASKAAPATKAAGKPTKKTAAKKPSAK